MKPLFALVLAFGAALAYAQQSATAPATGAIKHACEKPDPPGRLASDTQKKVFDRTFKKYKECIQKFIEDQQTVAKAASEASKIAYDEYNDFVTEYNKSIAKE